MRIALILLLCFACYPLLALAAPVVRGLDPSSDWQSRIDRELSKMREAAARLHEEGTKLWDTSSKREREDSTPVEKNNKQTQTRDGQKQEDDSATRLHQRATQEAPQHDAVGQGVQQDDAKTVLLITQAAERGDANAQCVLGTMYANGQGVPKNDVTAVQLYEKAARQNYAAAQYALGWMYAHGRGVQRDEAKAVQWCLHAAKQGIVTHASCQHLRRTAK